MELQKIDQRTPFSPLSMERQEGFAFGDIYKLLTLVAKYFQSFETCERMQQTLRCQSVQDYLQSTEDAIWWTRAESLVHLGAAVVTGGAAMSRSAAADKIQLVAQHAAKLPPLFTQAPIARASAQRHLHEQSMQTAQRNGEKAQQLPAQLQEAVSRVQDAFNHLLRG